MIARGIHGDLELLEDRVKIIRHKGLGTIMLQGLKGDKEITLRSITSIQFKPAGTMTRGYIQFAFMGGAEAKSGLFQAASDENTVLFDSKQQPEFLAIKEEIDRRRQQRPSTVSSVADEVAKFAALRDQGIITEQEFETKKKQLLGS